MEHFSQKHTMKKAAYESFISEHIQKIRELLDLANQAWKSEMGILDNNNRAPRLAELRNWNANALKNEIKKIISKMDSRYYHFSSMTGKPLKAIHKIFKEMQEVRDKSRGCSKDCVVAPNATHQELEKIEKQFLMAQNKLLTALEAGPKRNSLNEADSIYCVFCGEQNSANNDHCYACGEELFYDDVKECEIFCDNCGSANPDYANFCCECGEEIFNDEEDE